MKEYNSLNYNKKYKILFVCKGNRFPEPRNFITRQCAISIHGASHYTAVNAKTANYERLPF